MFAADFKSVEFYCGLSAGFELGLELGIFV